MLCRRHRVLPRRPSPSSRRSGPPPSEWVVPEGAHDYCVAQTTFGLRCHGSSHRRFAGERVGHFAGRKQRRCRH